MRVTSPARSAASREFQDQLGTYLESDKPEVITKDDRTVGFYIPTRGRPDMEDIAASQEAAARSMCGSVRLFLCVVPQHFIHGVRADRFQDGHSYRQACAVEGLEFKGCNSLPVRPHQ
jgi:hypothetical protein